MIQDSKQTNKTIYNSSFFTLIVSKNITDRELWYRIISVSSPGITSQNSFQRKPTSL